MLQACAVTLDLHSVIQSLTLDLGNLTGDTSRK